MGLPNVSRKWFKTVNSCRRSLDFTFKVNMKRGKQKAMFPYTNDPIQKAGWKRQNSTKLG